MRYIDTTTGRTVTEDELYDIVDECIDSDEYEDVVNKNEPPMKLSNGMTYDVGRVLRAVDPMYFEELRERYVEAVFSGFKHGYEDDSVHVRIEEDE